MYGADQHRLVLLQGIRRQSGTPRDGVIARRQITEVLVSSLVSEAAKRKTFELVAEQGTQQDDFEALFSVVKPDTEATNDGVGDQQNMPLAGRSSDVAFPVERAMAHLVLRRSGS